MNPPPDDGMALADAWSQWIKTPEGRPCINDNPPPQNPYLTNRLWHAFMAGAAAQRRIREGAS